MISRDESEIGLNLTEQRSLLGLSKSSYYRESKPSRDEKLREFTAEREAILDLNAAFPYYGARRLSFVMQSNGFEIGRKLTRDLMVSLGIKAIYPKPNLSKAGKGHKIYDYLLKGVEIIRPNQVWSTDITYLPTPNGWVYLVAVIDWYSRKILSWRLSNSMDTSFCIEALEEALEHGTPEIFNTDQGSQFTSNAFTNCLLSRNIPISMDGKGRALDNVYIERFWRSLKYECVFLHRHNNMSELRESISKYIAHYNNCRPHQSLEYQTPEAIWVKSA
jgi:putative transposase